MAVVLTGLAGYIDAIGYLTLGHVYIANMSGNSVATGIHFTWLHALPIGVYVVGAVCARALMRWTEDRRMRSQAAIPLGLELVLLIGFVLYPKGPLGIVMAALAMGVQVATLSKFHGVTVYTGFVTGSLTKFAENVSDVFWSRFQDRKARGQAVWFGLVWLAYVFGAAGGAVGVADLGSKVMWGGIGAVLALIVVDLVRPAVLDKVAEES